MIRRLAGPALALALVFGVSAALAQDGGLRGPVSAAAPANGSALIQAAPAPQITPRAPDPSLDLSQDEPDASKRLDRSVGDASLGGAECRGGCASAYYMCLETEDTDCPSHWSQCVVACPKTSGSL